MSAAAVPLAAPPVPLAGFLRLDRIDLAFLTERLGYDRMGLLVNFMSVGTFPHMKCFRIDVAYWAKQGGKSIEWVYAAIREFVKAGLLIVHRVAGRLYQLGAIDREKVLKLDHAVGGKPHGARKPPGHAAAAMNTEESANAENGQSDDMGSGLPVRQVFHLGVDLKGSVRPETAGKPERHERGYPGPDSDPRGGGDGKCEGQGIDRGGSPISESAPGRDPSREVACPMCEGRGRITALERDRWRAGNGASATGYKNFLTGYKTHPVTRVESTKPLVLENIRIGSEAFEQASTGDCYSWEGLNEWVIRQPWAQQNGRTVGFSPEMAAPVLRMLKRRGWTVRQFITKADGQAVSMSEDRKNPIGFLIWLVKRLCPPRA